MVARILRDLAQAQPKVHWLETAELVCPQGECAALRDGKIVFRDYQHLTATFVESTADYFREKIRDSLSK